MGRVRRKPWIGSELEMLDSAVRSEDDGNCLSFSKARKGQVISMTGVRSVGRPISRSIDGRVDVRHHPANVTKMRRPKPRPVLRLLYIETSARLRAVFVRPAGRACVSGAGACGSVLLPLDNGPPSG